jgi:BirA family transcriptional regulator, biotin operon repressor / biotin---[acetyl-CoA-carboxylase] ligase
MEASSSAHVVDHMHPDDIRSAILQNILNAPNHSVSGAKLSQVFGITRAAVWKHIHVLEGIGFEFRAAPRVGYQLIKQPDLCLPPLVSQALPRMGVFGHWMDWWQEVDSTNRVAMHHIAEIPHGGIVTAVRQSGGRGRRGKAWVSPAGGLWMSVVIKQPLALARAAELTLLTAVAVRRAILSETGLAVDIKWPNDLLYDGRKLCGILAEIRADGETVQHAVIGIGLNVNVAVDSLPSEIQAVATSIRGETGRTTSMVAMMTAILQRLEPLVDSLSENGAGFQAVAPEWQAHCITIGKSVTVQTPAGQIEGFATHADDHGVLYVRDSDGHTHAIHSGDVLFT